MTYLVGNRFNLFHASTVLYMYIIIDIVDKVGRILLLFSVNSNNVQKTFYLN